MSYLLKDLYSPAYYARLADVLNTTVPGFSSATFTAAIFDDAFAGKELKDRMKHTANVLHTFLPAEYGERIDLIERIISELRERNWGEDGLTFMFLPDYIETYGIHDYETSVRALELTTQFVSCEFAVRPFLLKYGDKMMAQMVQWSLHENHKVRRLASEGSRPRLPWAMAVPALKKDPSPVLPILENLKNDPNESVRLSVANNLNDIGKDHPQLVIDIATRWKGHSKETDAIIKHGSRTLLKQGHTAILSHFGLKSDGITIADFKIATPEIKIGQSVEFSFTLCNTKPTAETVRLEYAVYYLRQNGTASKKVFKISERLYQPREQAAIARKQSFKIITTRKFYPGVHGLSIIINGAEQEKEEFVLNA